MNVLAIVSRIFNEGYRHMVELTWSMLAHSHNTLENAINYTALFSLNPCTPTVVKVIFFPVGIKVRRGLLYYWLGN